MFTSQFIVDSVIDTCERYWSESKQKRPRKEEIPSKLGQELEKKKPSKRQSSKDNAIENGSTSNGSPVRQKQERKHSPEIFKRRKTNDVTDSGVAPVICKTG